MTASLVNVSLLILTAVSCMGLGTYILRKTGFLGGSITEDIPISVGFGLVVLTYCMATFGLIGFLHTRSAWGLLVIFGLFTFMAVRQPRLYQVGNMAKILRMFSLLDWLLIIVVFLIALGYLLVALSPSLESDSLFGHLVLPREYARQNSLVVVDYAYGTTFPQNAQLISTFGFLIQGQITAQLLVTWFPGIICISVIYALGRQFASHRAGLIALVIWYGMRSVAYLSTSAKLDMAWAAFDLLALLAFSRWYFAAPKERHWRWLVLSGVFLGAAGGAKSASFFTAIGLFIAIGVCLWKDSRKKPTHWLFEFLAMGIPALALAGVWAIRSILLTGEIGWTGSNLPGNTGIWGFFRTLWNMSMLGNAQALEGVLGKSIGPAILAILPLLLFFRRVDRKITHLLVFSLIIIVLWFFGVQRARHLLPTLGLLSVICGYLVALLCLHKRYLGYATITLLMFSMLLTFGQWSYINFVSLHRIPYVLGLQDMNGYLSDNLQKRTFYPNYPVITYAQQNLPEDARIASLSGGMSYYLDRHLYGYRAASPHLSTSWTDGPTDVPQAKRFAERLRSDGITHVFINDFVVEVRDLSQAWLANPEFQSSYLVRLFCADGQCLYEFR